MYNQLMFHNYKRLGFPVNIVDVDGWSKDTIATYPGWGAGFFVIDVDAHRQGVASFQQIKHLIPETVQSKTQSGGYHFYLKYPDGWRIDSTVNWLPGIDIMSEDSRITMPPTRGAKTGKKYEWINSPFAVEMALPSLQLLQILNAKRE